MPTYTTTSDIARVLRAGASGKVKFSDRAMSGVMVKDTNGNFQTLTSVDRDQVSITDDFQGSIKLKFDFTSATEFNVIEMDTVQRFEKLVGSGTISTSYATSDGLITIGAGTFGGTIAVGDNVTIEFDCHISVADVEAFIEDTETEVDTILTEGGMGYLRPGYDLLYEDSVPPAIATVTAYLTAYYVYTDIFSSKFTDEKQFESSYTRRWKKRAEDLLMKYIKAHRREIPSVLSFPSYVDKFGIRGVGPGTDTLGESEEDILREAHSDYQQDGLFWNDDVISVDAE